LFGDYLAGLEKRLFSRFYFSMRYTSTLISLLHEYVTSFQTLHSSKSLAHKYRSTHLKSRLSSHLASLLLLSSLPVFHPILDVMQDTMHVHVLIQARNPRRLLRLSNNKLSNKYVCKCNSDVEVSSLPAYLCVSNSFPTLIQSAPLFTSAMKCILNHLRVPREANSAQTRSVQARKLTTNPSPQHANSDPANQPLQ